ncbi:MAG: hypothetical protein HUJ56_01345 [Erysipelotrichaceae bacterium]|nr:hypothetical protein [Erysipelotrichaceae bacterium]
MSDEVRTIPCIVFGNTYQALRKYAKANNIPMSAVLEKLLDDIQDLSIIASELKRDEE